MEQFLLRGAFAGQLTQILDDQQIVTPQSRAPLAKLLPVEGRGVFAGQFAAAGHQHRSRGQGRPPPARQP